jgi:hypothetical protein
MTPGHGTVTLMLRCVGDELSALHNLGGCGLTCGMHLL